MKPTRLDNRLKDIVNHFVTEGTVVSVEPFGSGHINDSYLVKTLPESAPDYVLQRINHNVFRNIPELTSNILKVTRHLASKKSESDGGFEVLQMIRSVGGEYYHKDPDGNYWRLYQYIGGSRSYDIVENPSLAYEGGKAFGHFHAMTSGMDASGLFEVLPDFHNIETRLKNFYGVLDRDPEKRAAKSSAEIAFVRERVKEMHRIADLIREGKVALRVTHNDTKCNNILFNPEGHAICIIDLDTIMPGTILYDFGDAIRTGASTGAEDEADLSKIDLDLNLFEAYARGYLEVAREFLSPEEIANLAFSARYMTFLIGLRFLTDHLDGDHYYRIRFPGHNLQRARAQFRLVTCIENKLPEMKQIIERIKS
jgi:Ser/Thr protein kinase RdoA (MazF antagonist)